MGKLVWDEVGKKYFETGVKKGVLFPQDSTLGTYPKGVAWSGLISVTESPSGAEVSSSYADDIEYINMISTEKFAGTIEAFYYPEEFNVCQGSVELVKGAVIGQQARKTFGLCYRTSLGNDTDGQDHGYKLHFIYGALAAPSEKAYKTVNDSPEANNFSWAIKATPVSIAGFKPSATVTVDSTTTDPTKLAALEKIIYGDDTAPATEARLPLPDEIKTLLTVVAG